MKSSDRDLNVISINLNTDPLTPPAIALDQRNGVYVEGETVTLTCTTSGEHRGKIYFYEEQRLLTFVQLLTKDNTGQFSVTNRHQGKHYQCKYGIYAKARWLESQLSEAVAITVTGEWRELDSVD